MKGTQEVSRFTVRKNFSCRLGIKILQNLNRLGPSIERKDLWTSCKSGSIDH